MKPCKDCKYHVKTTYNHWCNAKNCVDPDSVNTLSRLCKLERRYGWMQSLLFSKCGREGRFFQPKDTTHDTP